MDPDLKKMITISLKVGIMAGSGIAGQYFQENGNSGAALVCLLLMFAAGFSLFWGE